ncbi:hypothetical protein ACH4TX_43995 [Streptomyces sp. NPDC021098]|uniref:hypothetical protein n=1 Tax=unclassified Streptomyces TaxID=2593676 RepID=UPI0037911626
MLARAEVPLVRPASGPAQSAAGDGHYGPEKRVADNLVSLRLAGEVVSATRLATGPSGRSWCSAYPEGATGDRADGAAAAA